jgi:hypothetical protein
MGPGTRSAFGEKTGARSPDRLTPREVPVPGSLSGLPARAAETAGSEPGIAARVRAGLPRRHQDAIGHRRHRLPRPRAPPARRPASVGAGQGLPHTPPLPPLGQPDLNNWLKPPEQSATAGGRTHDRASVMDGRWPAHRPLPAAPVGVRDGHEPPARTEARRSVAISRRDGRQIRSLSVMAMTSTS